MANQSQSIIIRQLSDLEPLLAELISPIWPWLSDLTVDEIQIQPGRGFCTGSKEPTEVKLEVDAAWIDRVATLFGNKAGQHPDSEKRGGLLSVGFANWRVTASLPPAARVAELIIRKYQPKRFTLADLVGSGVLGERSSSMLATAFAVEKKRVLVVGPTFSGKTTLMNALLQAIPHHLRLVTVEDTPELDGGEGNWQGLFVQADGHITYPVAIAQTLRLTPDFLVVGEVRGKGGDAFFAIEALATGHGGGFTVHGGSVQQGLSLLAQQVMQTAPAGTAISPDQAQRMVNETIDVIAVVRRVDEGGRKIRRLIQLAIRQDNGLLKFYVMNGKESYE